MSMANIDISLGGKCGMLKSNILTDLLYNITFFEDAHDERHSRKLLLKIDLMLICELKCCVCLPLNKT